MTDTVSSIAAAGTDLGEPLVTIAIPTFRRLDLLVEAVSSALNQKFDRPYEIIVLDNDPESKDADRLLQEVPQLKTANFRYYVNAENVGMYGNHNLAIKLARGQWLTILHDDDLLDGHFLSTMFSALDSDRRIDGIVCRKRFFDQRAVETKRPAAGTQLLARKMSLRTAAAYVVSGQGARRELAGRFADRLITTYFRSVDRWFRRASTRRIQPAALFWAPITGNVVGFMFRRSCALEIGGFYPDESPSSDDRFYIRFAGRFDLRQHRLEAAALRIAENETLKVATVKAALLSKWDLHRLMAGREVPEWYLRFSPLIMTRLWVEYREFWRTEVPFEELEHDLGMKLPADQPRLLFIVRIFLNAW